MDRGRENGTVEVDSPGARWLPACRAVRERRVLRRRRSPEASRRAELPGPTRGAIVHVLPAVFPTRARQRHGGQAAASSESDRARADPRGLGERSEAHRTRAQPVVDTSDAVAASTEINCKHERRGRARREGAEEVPLARARVLAEHNAAYERASGCAKAAAWRGRPDGQQGAGERSGLGVVRISDAIEGFAMSDRPVLVRVSHPHRAR